MVRECARTPEQVHAAVARPHLKNKLQREKYAFLFSRCRNAPDTRLQGCRVSTNISTKAVSIQATVEQNVFPHMMFFMVYKLLY